MSRAPYAELIKNAIELYNGIIGEIKKGWEYLICDAAGTVYPFRMFL